MFEFDMPSLAKIIDRFFLSLKSVRGYHLPFFFTWKREEFADPGVMARITFKAETGHMY